jgi:predicted nicotinamide N-methyase
MGSSPANLRAFVRRHTRLLPVRGLPGISLQQADDVTMVWRAAGKELGQADPPLPYWAFAWSGGLAVAHYLVDHPDEVERKHVLDLATGSGLCAVVALRCGAASARGVDVDPLSEAAVAINARANGVRVAFSRRDLLDEEPPGVDVILAGDVCYEETMAERMLAWLDRAARDGARVLLGDPGRTYLPSGLQAIAGYHVATSREIEEAFVKTATVYTFPSNMD